MTSVHTVPKQKKERSVSKGKANPEESRANCTFWLGLDEGTHATDLTVLTGARGFMTGRVDLPEFKSQLCYLRAIRLWTVTSVSLRPPPL